MNRLSQDLRGLAITASIAADMLPVKALQALI
jgi:hypothetical protein